MYPIAPVGKNLDLFVRNSSMLSIHCSSWHCAMVSMISHCQERQCVHESNELQSLLRGFRAWFRARINTVHVPFQSLLSPFEFVLRMQVIWFEKVAMAAGSCSRTISARRCHRKILLAQRHDILGQVKALWMVQMQQCCRTTERLKGCKKIYNN